MRRRKMCVRMMILCLMLASCGASSAESKAEQLALTIRTEYLAMTACSGQVDITADYGQRVYSYSAQVSWEKEGDTLLTLTAPEEAAGLTARIRNGETWLEYDGISLETGPLTPEGLAPIDAIPALLTYVREGFMAECGEETLGERETVKICCRDPEEPAGSGIEASLWLDWETHALLQGEISSDGYTVLRCVFHDFQFTLPPS